MMNLIGFNFSKTVEKQHVELFFSYAKSDISANKFTWQLFFNGLSEAGKNNDFFPTYNKVVIEVNRLKCRSNAAPVTIEESLPEGKPISKEQRDYFFAKFQEMLDKKSFPK